MDIDIDFKTSFDPTELFPAAIPASKIDGNHLKRHNCGAYFQAIPKDPVTGVAAIPYKQASEHGFLKIDFLHLSFLDIFDDKQQIRALLRKPPRWGLLLRSDVVGKLFQLGNHAELVQKVQPKSIQEVADCISLIRPGKINLTEEYLENRETTRAKLYKISKNDKYSYKKGHALSYALIVVLELHLIDAGIL